MEALEELRGSPPKKNISIKEFMALQEVKLFYKILYEDSTTDFRGFYCLSTKQHNKFINHFSTYNLLNNEFILANIVNKNDVYISPNSFKEYKRLITSLYQIRCIYVDLDIKEKEFNKVDVYISLLQMIKNKEIPPPTMIIDSGRGYHLYFRIKDSNPNKIVKDMWNKTQNKLNAVLKELGADSGAKDLVRILRVPTSINSKNNAVCKIIQYDENLIYTLTELKNFCFKNNYEKIENKNYKKDFNKLNKRFLGDYKTLNESIILDLEKLLKLREYDIKDYRNKFLFIYAVYLNLIKFSEEEINKKFRVINKKLIEPLKLRELKAISKSAVINGRVNDSLGILELSNFKDNVPNEGYKFKNSTIIEWLDISEDEMKELKILINSEEVRKRKNSNQNEVKKKVRRDKNGLTKKQKEQKEKRKKALKLQSQGFSIRDISKELKCSLGSIQNLLK